MIYSLEFSNHQPGGGDKAIVTINSSYRDIRPKIDSGFIYEEVLNIDSNYDIRSERYNKLPPINSSYNQN